MKKLYLRWIPHNLTEAQKTDRVTWCNAMLNRFKAGTSNLVWDVITAFVLALSKSELLAISKTISKVETGIEIWNKIKVRIDYGTRIKINSVTRGGMRSRTEVRLGAGQGPIVELESESTKPRPASGLKKGTR
ncbi:hypothetical protein EVAR_58521_1 [Eumeta japonica]|uniref:Uncharacterized protein n=1 Tax=Eumeta variegata TaxID=151549 RepID=A0A4C1YWB1_EUMVA|nr:hypothetical protein EVAR_58521_1 [Eumeta japonica]